VAKREAEVDVGGLTFARYFTSEGRHPFDEIEWEVRDAVIPNYKEGGNAFEQRDVEFPKAWSQNATNIVAQKYFRGPLGTPQRESSVRQLVSRVVDTIRGWGDRNGYFATDHDADVFADELSHLLVNQKAAFNSPVWFNVGVPDTPQQCSACQPYGALVSTPAGLVPIGRLVEDDAVGTKVFDASGVTRIVATKSNGVKDVLRVHTKAGQQLDVTADHLVWRSSGAGTGAFVPAASLRPGDKLEWHRRGSFGESEIDVVEMSEAALAGWLQSDGFVGQYEGTNRSLTIEAMTVTDAEHAWVTEAIDRVLPDVHRHERSVTTIDTTLDCRRIRLYGTQLEDFVGRWDLRARGVDMTVPERLFTAPLPVVATYLRSLFQAEGYVSIGRTSAHVGLAMVSERLVRGVQDLLTRFGIFSRVSFKADSRPDRKGCWCISINTVGDQDLFAAEIGFVDPRKAEKLEQAIDRVGVVSRETKRLEIAAIERVGPMEVYDIQTESGEYLSGNLRVHNCFILAVDDTMSSILNWYVEEGTIFKGGSGSGINLSRIRSSKEALAGGGTASGPVSFMRGADASAGTIKSGGKTRRAAKMVILDVDHPDVEDFIWCKANEEKKARALRDAGFDMDLDGKDSHSIQYQNANNSVRVTDEFMRAFEQDQDWRLKAVLTDETLETIRARDLMQQIAQAAWECADPGMQYDTTINEWHTCPATGRINASNPCFTGDMRVHTDQGLIRFDDLLRRVTAGESFDVYTHDMTNPDEPGGAMRLSAPTQLMVNGVKEIVRLGFSDGREIRCTPNHRLWTLNRAWVRADELAPEDELPVLDQPTPAVMADHMLPVAKDWRAVAVRGDWSRELELPEKWEPELAHFVGWLVGDGSISGNVVTTVYGSKEDQAEILPRHLELLTRLNGGRAPKPSRRTNGTMQLRLSRRPLARFFEALGVKASRAVGKEVPWSIFEAPADVVGAFLKGLFDADGCAVDLSNGTRYVGLGSKSQELLRGVQMLLTSLGMKSRVYDVTGKSAKRSFTDTRKGDGTTVEYASTGASYDLRIFGDSVPVFLALVGFGLSRKLTKLAIAVQDHSTHRSGRPARLVSREHDGFEQTYNLTEPVNHSYVVNGSLVANCSEYMHLDNSACNLASLNLMKFLGDDGTFDVASFKHAVEIVFTAQEIIVGEADYPTKAIGENARAFRQLGLGYANLGALLMARGLPYDSDAGRAWAGALTSIMTGWAYRTSARIAGVTGPFEGYLPNADPMLRVMRKHRAAAEDIDGELVPEAVLTAAKQSWDEAVALGERNGYRNAQGSVLAPTGTIGLMMDCDTTGIEPELALVKTKKLVGGGTMQFVNQTVPRALSRLGYEQEQVADVVGYIAEHNSVADAPHLKPEHYAVFDTAMGAQPIHYMGHVRMMAAAQPFISGAISKTVNMPEEATVEEVEQLFTESWKLGLKAVAIYRDNCKVAQPLSADKKKTVAEPVALSHPVRRRLPRSRPSVTTKFEVGDAEGYITASSYPDDGLGEIFLKTSKQGSTLAGVMDAFSIAISIGLQYGVPLEAYVEKFVNMKFEPSGMTNDPDIRFASSLVDYVFRRLALDFVESDRRDAMGIRSIDERKSDALEQIGEPAFEEDLPADPEPAPAMSVRKPVEPTERPNAKILDAPLCYTCGSKMQPAGSCYLCASCGSTSGCS
jgi:ribonucleotide reductase alpha subunit